MLWGDKVDTGYTITKMYQHCLYLNKTSSHQWSNFLVETTTQIQMFQGFLLVLPFWGWKGELEENYLGKFRSKVILSLASHGGICREGVYSVPLERARQFTDFSNEDLSAKGPSNIPSLDHYIFLKHPGALALPKVVMLLLHFNFPLHNFVLMPYSN